MPKQGDSFYVFAELISATDGSAVTTGTTAVYLTKDDGIQAHLSDADHVGNGLWRCLPGASHTNATSVSFLFVNSAAIPVNVMFYLDTLVVSDLSVWAGSTSETYTVTDGADPLAGVEVQMSTDSAGSNIVARGLTDASGKVSLRHDLSSGTTVYLWRYKAGYTFTNPDTETTT